MANKLPLRNIRMRFVIFCFCFCGDCFSVHVQMSSLVKDNKILVVKLHQTSKGNRDLKSHYSGSNGVAELSSSHEFSAARDRNEKESGFLAKMVHALNCFLPV